MAQLHLQIITGILALLAPYSNSGQIPNSVNSQTFTHIAQTLPICSGIANESWSNSFGIHPPSYSHCPGDVNSPLMRMFVGTYFQTLLVTQSQHVSGPIVIRHLPFRSTLSSPVSDQHSWPMACECNLLTSIGVATILAPSQVHFGGFQQLHLQSTAHCSIFSHTCLRLRHRSLCRLPSQWPRNGRTQPHFTSAAD